jgi:crotonobetainyl-CoA:carnitine CoA-transferase CaiB-like acyl-CoA transferase
VVPIAPVRSMAEARDLDELTARGMLAEYEDETFGRVRSVGLPLHVGGFEPSYRPGPSLGQDTDAILAELGYGPVDVERLHSAGAFGRSAASPGDPSAP